jgi:hypothetical protein
MIRSHKVNSQPSKQPNNSLTYPWNSDLLQRLTLPQLLRNFPHFMEAKYSGKFSQKPSNIACSHQQHYPHISPSSTFFDRKLVDPYLIFHASYLTLRPLHLYAEGYKLLRFSLRKFTFVLELPLTPKYSFHRGSLNLFSSPEARFRTPQIYG